MAKRKDENDALRFEKVVERDVAALAVGDEELVQASLRRTSDQRVARQHRHGFSDVGDGLGGCTGVVVGEEVEQPFEVRKRVLDVDYLRHDFGCGRTARSPASLASR